MDYKANLSPQQKLDIVLQKLVNLSETHNISYREIAVNVSAQGYEKEIFEILLKLEKDGYVTSTDNNGNRQYYSNFDGRLFIDNGGYVKAKKVADENLTISSHTLTQDKIYRTHLLWATWSAGIAALLLLLWQVWIWFYPVHSNYPYWIWQTIPK